MIQVRAHVGMISGSGHGMIRRGLVDSYLGGELTGPAKEGLEAVSDPLVAPLTKMEQVLAMSSGLDMLNWGNSGE